MPYDNKSSHEQFLLRFVEAEKDDNIKIINNVAKALNNQNITNAVEAAFKIKEGSTIDPFTTLEELYTIREDGRSMKRTYGKWNLINNITTFGFQKVSCNFRYRDIRFILNRVV